MSDFTDHLASVCAVLVSPMNRDGSVDLHSAGRLAAAVGASQAGTVTVGGSVGEFLALTAAERRDLLRVTVSTVGRKPVLAAVGGALPEAIEEAGRSAGLGASAVMVHQPGNPFGSVAGWVAYHLELARAIAPLPVVLYLRDPAVDAAALGELAAACPNVVGVKYAVPDPIALTRLVSSSGDRLVWLSGLAEKWAPSAWQAGATGFTSGLVQLNDSVPTQMLHALRAGDQEEARRTWEAAARFEDLRARRAGAANVGVVKNALMMAGVIRTATVRPPVTDLTAAETSLVKQLLADPAWANPEAR